MPDTDDTEVPDLTALKWRKEINDTQFLVATARELIDEEFVNKSFASDEMPWAKALSKGQLEKMLDNSLTFALFEEASSPHNQATGTTLESTNPVGDDTQSSIVRRQVGMARIITDHITFAYLTDVYIMAEYRRSGHARWLMACCREVMEAIPVLRRGFLITGLSYGAEFYRETLGFYNVVEEAAHNLVALTGKPLKK